MASVSSTLVGRDVELDELLQAVGVGTEETGHVLLSGDAGVGKTRLLMALRDAALADGWQVAAGHCLDFGDSPPPYLPFSEILGRLAVDQPTLVADAVAERPALARLQPGRRATAGRGETDTLDRTDMFDAVHRLLEGVAGQAPLLVVVEDTHWADQSTRDMVGFLYSRPYAARVAVVVSYRSDDLHRRHPLRRNVAEWSRLREVSRVALSPLPDAAVRTLVGELVPEGLAPEELAAIIARAEGNAFFVEELVGAAAGPDLPVDLADLLLVRLDRLDEASRSVVRAASVSGRRVSHAVLATVCELSDADLDEGLRRAVESNILVAADGHYSFRHALLGEAVYDDLLPGERVRLHGRYVAALLDRGDETGIAAALARHAWFAKDLDVALQAGIRAGDEALGIGGPDEAVRHYERVLELLSDPRRRADAAVDRTRVVGSLADALTATGRPARAASVVAEELAMLSPEAPPTERARLLASRASALWLTEFDRPEMLAILDEAAELSIDDRGSLRADVLGIQARVLSALGRFEEAESAGLDALALAERLDLHDIASEAVTTLSGLKRSGPKEGLRAALADAVARAQAAGATHPELRARFLMGRSFQDWGEYDQAAEWFRSGMERATEAGLPWAPYGFEARWQLTWIHYVRGDWDRSVALAQPVGEDPPGVPRALLAGGRLMIEQARSVDPVRIEAEARALRRWWASDGAVAVNSTGVEIRAAGQRGDWQAAVAAYDDVVGVLSALWHPYFGARIRLAATAIAAVCAALPRLPAAERPDALAATERLLEEGLETEPLQNKASEPSGHWGPEGRAWSRRLAAEGLRARWLADGSAPEGELVAAWRAAEAAYVEFGHVYELALVRTVLSTILRSTGDVVGAREVADLARETARMLGAKPLLDELRSSPAPTGSSDSLTARESEILALVAEGRSNGEIGKQLFISTKTVSVHVSNILGKLGASGRTEAAAIARRKGLLG